MTRFLSIDVRGLPRAQGSLTQWKMPDGRTATRYHPAVYAWRAQVQQAVTEALGDDWPAPAFHGPVELRLHFDLPYTNSHYLPANTRRPAPELRADAPLWPIVAPDLDKLVRLICDSCTDAGLWKDDAQVAALEATKQYTTGPPGVMIGARELPVTPD